MSEPIARHQLFDYNENEPFVVINAPALDQNGKTIDDAKQLLHHWHEELEVAYILNGKSMHYIDGVCVEGVPGRLVVTNSESVHNIIVENVPGDEPVTGSIVLLIHAQFLREQFPQYQTLYFTNERTQAGPEIRDIMLHLSAYADRKRHNAYEFLYAKGLILQLLYYMCEQGTVRRDMVNVNEQKNIERLKGVLQYVENHYMEPLSQAEVAARFYFNREYFSRYFKKCTGMNFTEYLARFRLEKAKKMLVRSDRRVLDIALENGFSDERRLINAFKRYYGTTPLQYRKLVKNNAKEVTECSM